MRRFALAGLIALWPTLASAQFATIGPTPATSDNGDRLATTAWVNLFATGSIPLQSGKIFIGSGGNLAVGQTPSGDCTLSLSGVITCTQAAGNFQVIGNLTVGGSIIDGNGILFTNIVAPATPAAGTTRGYVDSTSKRFSDKNDAGTVGNTVVASLAVANQFMTGISIAGIITRAQPAFTDISGAAACAQLPALTGNVTSSACATTIGANQVARTMEAQGVARSVIGVTGNAGANVADIQGTTDQVLRVTAAGTGLSFGQVNLAAAAAVTGTLPIANGGTNDTGTAWASYTPSISCGGGTTTGSVPTGFFKTIGKTTFVRLILTTSTTTCTGATLGLPNTSQGGVILTGRESLTNGALFLCASAASAATCSVFGATGSGSAALNNSLYTFLGVYDSQ